MKKKLIQTAGANSIEANIRAQNSNRAAKTARLTREELYKISLTLDEWGQIFINSAVTIGTALFLLSTAMELFFSWPMYIDMMSQMTGTGNNYLAAVGGGFLVFWGAYVSHLIAKRMSRAMLKYHVFNMTQTADIKTPIAAVEEKGRAARNRDFTLGIILGGVLLLVVAAISWQRVWLISDITGADYSLLHKLLPVICVLVEILSGIFISYLIARLMKVVKVKRLKHKFEKEKSECAYETMMTQEYQQQANKSDEQVPYSKELHDCLYRYENRSQDNENYVDEIPAVKTLKVVVADVNGLKAGVHIAGVLSNGEYCNTITTNEKGEGILTWHSDAKEVLKVYTNNVEHNGFFKENSVIRIDLKDEE